ncbi:unnamed protein product [Pylaiella littoralis]
MPIHTHAVPWCCCVRRYLVDSFQCRSTRHTAKIEMPSNKRKSADGEDAAAAASKKARSKGSTSSTPPTKEKGKPKACNKGKGKGSSGGDGGGDATAAAAAAKTMERPTRNKQGQLVFPDFPKFRPNLSPKQVLRMGSFGGTYFRPIKSSVTGKSYRDQWKEFPADWFEGLNVKARVANPTYFNSVNTYGVHCGGDLDMWESNGWIKECDPYGWFQWYCRFYLGRRCYDDERQISRGLKVFGPTGRWRTQLCNRILTKGTSFDDHKISPKIRQLLQHWGYRITEADVKAHAAKKK